MGRAIANNRLRIESGRHEQSHPLIADASLSPAFRGFIEIWARKIESVEQRANTPALPGTIEEFNSSLHQDLV
jgi:hypothetical protein